MAFNTLIKGLFTNTLQPCFSAYKSSSAANATGDGTTVDVVFDTSLVNVGTSYNTSTGVFTAPATGNYLFSSSVMFNNATAGAGYTIFLGSVYSTSCGQTDANGLGNTIIEASWIIPMTAGDTMKVQAFWTGTTKTVNIYGSAISSAAGYQSHFSGHLIS